MLSFCRGAWI
uniref:Uncharacterized protein n=1 Tax=Arundo donax TaxID=35708 RepID=A0A0A8Z8P7_ARUDO